MTIYESIYNEIQRRYDEGEITYEQACDVNDLAYEKYVVEGANMDNFKTFYSARKDLKEINKKIKEAKKEGNNLKIKKYAHDGAKTCDDCIKELKKLDNTTGEAVIGFFTSWIPAFNRDFVITAALSIPEMAGIAISPSDAKPVVAIAGGANAIAKGTIVRGIEKIDDEIATIKNLYKNRNDLHTKDFNMARNKCIHMMESYKKAYEKLAK